MNKNQQLINTEINCKSKKKKNIVLNDINSNIQILYYYQKIDKCNKVIFNDFFYKVIFHN